MGKKGKLSQSLGKIETMRPMTMILIVVTLTVLLVLYISNLLAIRNLSQETGELADQLNKEKIETQKQETKVDQLESIERIQSIAKKDLGLAFPKSSPRIVQVPAAELKNAKEK